MTTMKVLVRGEGGLEKIVDLPADSTPAQLLTQIGTVRRAEDLEAECLVFLEDQDDALELEAKLGENAEGLLQVHANRCRIIATAIYYGKATYDHPFPPSATIGRVHRWITNKLKMSDAEAAEHVLQVHGTTNQPAEDSHVGSLTSYPNCQVAFDLVRKPIMNGAN